jgi:peptidoglycan-N-acetylglucosamine deacetylase
VGSSQFVSALALTFDDGPDPVWTPRLLDVLDRLGARVTFFPIARRAAAQPVLIQRVRAAGHTIGLHCDEHVRHGDRDEVWLRKDTSAALASLAQLGITPRLWRTPWGDTASWSTRVARDYGLSLAGWDVDTHDWRGDGAESMFDATGDALQDGAVVLAHDGIGPGARRPDTLETIRYVELVGADANRRGLVLEALR